MNSDHNLFHAKAIGYYQSLGLNRKNSYDVGRQSTDRGGEGFVKLLKGYNFEQALIGLSGARRIWILFQFNKNNQWKPMVLPPRGSDQKVGVFATRSPFRPNPIGISSMELKKIVGLKIFVHNNDLLDGTPILDIKPYLTSSDSFENCGLDWLDQSLISFQINLTPVAEKQLSFLKHLPIRDFILNQLEYEPTHKRKKRIISTHTPNVYILCYRTWRIEFKVELNKYYVTINRLFSGYSPQELISKEDKYGDKELHRSFEAHLDPTFDQ